MLLLKKIHERSIILMWVFALLVGFTSACIDDDGSRDSVGFTQGASHDSDNDGVPDNPDNCPGIYNPGQENNDGDLEGYDEQQGDACDDDDDNDGVKDVDDNCQFTYNSDQLNTDQDLDKDSNTTVGDNMGDACDPDDDNDGVCDMGVMLYNADVLPKSECEGWDNCQFTYNPDQENLDEDYWGDVCDNDWDWDGVLNDEDNCPQNQNRFQEDSDGDCDDEDVVFDGSQSCGDACDPDDDNDGACDPHHEARLPSAPSLEESPDQCEGWDNCPDLYNPGQEDSDGDLLGNWCDGDCRGDGFFEAYYPEDFPNHWCDGDDNCTLDSEDCIEWCNNNGQGQCNDHDPCTDDDCEDNVCEHDLDLENDDCQLECDESIDCADGNVCTDDVCHLGQCFHPNNTASCDDGLYCNGVDTCNSGTCGHAGNPCLPLVTTDADCTGSCDEVNNNCNLADENGTACNDANSCTTSDTCSSGQCVGTPIQECGVVDLHGDTPPGVGGGNGGPNADGTDDAKDDDGDCYCETAPCTSSVNSACGPLLGGDCDDDPDDSATTLRNPGPNQFFSDGSYYNNPGTDGHQPNGNEWWDDNYDNDCDNVVDDGFTPN